MQQQSSRLLTNSQNPQPFWDAQQPSPAGPWGWPDENFQSGFWHPKWCQWGPFRIRTARCRYQNPPRRPRKNVRMTQNPQPFWARPPSPLQCGFWVPGSQPANPWQLYILYLQTGDLRTHSKNDVNCEKNWVLVVHRLGESPKCSAKLRNPGGWFQLGK